MIICWIDRARWDLSKTLLIVVIGRVVEKTRPCLLFELVCAVVMVCDGEKWVPDSQKNQDARLKLHTADWAHSSPHQLTQHHLHPLRLHYALSSNVRRRRMLWIKVRLRRRRMVLSGCWMRIFYPTSWNIWRFMDLGRLFKTLKMIGLWTEIPWAMISIIIIQRARRGRIMSSSHHLHQQMEIHWEGSISKMIY